MSFKIDPKFFDANGLLGNFNEHGWDGGDSANKTGLLYLAQPNLIAFNSALSKLEVEPGVYVRNPKSPWNATFDGDWAFSRDQQTPLVLAMCHYDIYENRLQKLFEVHKARNWKYQNNDVASPEHVNYYNRSLGIPINKWGDWFMLFNSLIICAVSWVVPSRTTNDPNHTAALYQARYMQSTKIANIARWLYFKLRRRGVQWAWDSYFKNNPPLNKVWEPIIEEMSK